MARNVSEEPSVIENTNFGEIAAIERTLKSSFERLNDVTKEVNQRGSDANYFDLGTVLAAADSQKSPCLDSNHHVSLIDVSGTSAAAIVEFTDCSGTSFSDLYVLQKHQNEWAISQKVWDSHAYV